jgi:hypothetical protein
LFIHFVSSRGIIRRTRFDEPPVTVSIMKVRGDQVGPGVLFFHFLFFGTWAGAWTGRGVWTGTGAWTGTGGWGGRVRWRGRFIVVSKRKLIIQSELPVKNGILDIRGAKLDVLRSSDILSP